MRNAAEHVSTLVNEGIRFNIEIVQYAGIVVSEVIQSEDYSKMFFTKIWKNMEEKTRKIS